MSRFPHLTANGNESTFPDISNIRTYQYDNNYDYSKFDTVQMNITLCKVPWDMGEAHIGNRTISGIGNVVHFGTKAERDAWFDGIDDSECFRFATKYRELHRDNAIVVPIPYDVAARYNYIAVYYEPMASAENPVMYEAAGGIDAWFWFVREVEFLSPNSTKLHLLNDAWQTFIYDMDIPYMMLDRGHAPMHQTGVSAYLSNPIANCKYLLAPEENEPEPPRITTSTHAKVFNSGDVSAVIITTSNPAGFWGSKVNNNWHVPSVQVYVGGVPSYYAFAVDAKDLQTFLANISGNYPQFLQTVQCVFFISTELLDVVGSFTWAGTTCKWIHAYNKTVNIHNIAKSDFGYPAQYADIAKLYTYPYSMLVLTDNEGNRTEIRIEDTNGKLNFNCVVSLVYPWLKINGSISGVGKAPATRVSFTNIDSGNMPIQGNWHDLLFSLDIPVFGVTQSAAETNDYSTHFDRRQQDTAAANAQANQQANADNVTANAALQAAANTTIASISNTSTATDSNITQTYNSAAATGANYIIAANATSTIAAAEQQATIGAVSSVAQGAVGAIGSGNVAGAVASIAGGLIGAAGTMASVSVANALTSAQSGNAQTSNNIQATNSNISTNAKAGMQQTAVSDTASAQNALTTGSAANTSATLYANAARDRATVTSAIANQQYQAALGEPSTFGDFQNGDYATSRPLALFSNVVTQDDYTIRKCGDDFLRYGYSYGAQWQFDGNWCPMKHFTYWRLTDFWVKGLQIPDMYVDKLRFFLFGGVTVWKNPEDIGHVTIYENV